MRCARVELRLRCRGTNTLLRPVFADSRKHRGNVSSIRRAHPRAPLSSEAVRVGPCKDRTRARRSTSARDCARFGVSARPTQTRRHLSDANVSVGCCIGELPFPKVGCLRLRTPSCNSPAFPAGGGAVRRGGSGCTSAPEFGPVAITRQLPDGSNASMVRWPSIQRCRGGRGVHCGYAGNVRAVN